MSALARWDELSEFSAREPERHDESCPYHGTRIPPYMCIGCVLVELKFDATNGRGSVRDFAWDALSELRQYTTLAMEDSAAIIEGIEK